MATTTREETNELVMFENVRMIKNHLVLPENTTFDEWVDIGKNLKTAEGAIQFLIGDWINFGERKYGDKYLIAMAQTGFTVDYLRRIAMVSKKFNGYVAGDTTEGLATRHENLSFTHHVEVVSLPGPVAERLLEKSEKEYLTRDELRAEVREWKTEHRTPEQNKQQEILFSWFHDPDIEAMLDGMQKIRTGINKLMHDQRDPEVRKDLLCKVRNLMTDIDDDIRKYLVGSK